MKPTSRTLSWAFVIIMLAVGIFTALGIILMHKQPLVLQGQAEATEIRISGKLPGRIDTFLVQEGDWVRQGDTLVVINSPEIHAKYQQVDRLLLPRCNYGTKQKVILHWLKQLITVFLPYIKTVLSLPSGKMKWKLCIKLLLQPNGQPMNNIRWR